MEFKGTKGEWRIVSYDATKEFGKWTHEITSEEGKIAEMIYDEDDAKLIAASKDLLMQEQFNLAAFTKILGMIPEEGEIPDPGQFIMDVQNTVFARFKATRAAIQKALS